MDKKETRNRYSLLWLSLATFLVISFKIFSDNKLRLLLGGLFLIIYGITESLKERNISYFLFTSSIGIIAIVVALLLPKHINLFLILFYFLIFTLVIVSLYHYIKIGDKFKPKENIKEWIFRIVYFIISLIFISLVLTLIREIIPFYISAEDIDLTRYILFVIILFTSLFSFYLFIDNIFRIWIGIKGSSEIFPKVFYRAYYSFFLSLSSLILVGGYFYINNESNEIFQKLMITIVAAFFTSLIITSSLKHLLEKRT